MTETPLSATLGLLAFGVLVLLIAAVIANVRWPHKHPARQAGSAPLPERGTKRQCDSNGCGYPAGVWVIVAEDLGGGVRFVCHGCADEGTAHGWWRARLPKDATPLDFEIADDLPRIERFANGEAS